MKKTDRVVGQISSGRWLLTIIAGVCLLMLTILNCRAYMKYPDKPLPVSVEAIFTVITMVFVSYFSKKEVLTAYGNPTKSKEIGQNHLLFNQK